MEKPQATLNQQLAAQREELVARLWESLQATLFTNRVTIRPAHLRQIAQEEAEAFLAFLEDGDLAPVRERGARRLRDGLSERAVLDLATTLRLFCAAHLTSDLLLEGLRATDTYTAAFMEGYLGAREALVLEEQEKIRTALERALRAASHRLEVATEVAQALSGVVDPEELLQMAARLIRERFNLYYAGIFLTDEYGQWAVLRAGEGEEGTETLAPGLKLQVGDESSIGQCIARSEPLVFYEVGERTTRWTPLLPETRAEAILPLVARGRAAGALVLCSRRTPGFTPEDVTAFQVLASQVASALENARLFAEVQARVREIEAVHRRYLREEWSQFISTWREHRPVGYAYEGPSASLSPLTDGWWPAMDEVVQKGTAVALSGAAPTALPADTGIAPKAALAVPLVVRGEVVGALGLYEVERERSWSAEEIALVEAISAQVAMAVENARLFEEARLRAEELAVLNELGQALAAQLDVQQVLEEAYRGASRLLDATNFYIALYDLQREEVIFPLFVEENERQPYRTRPFANGLTEYIIRNKKPVLIEEDIPAHLQEMGVDQIGRIAQSWLGVPLIVGEQVLGVMAVQSYTTPRAYGQHDLDLMTAIASQVAIALQNARSYKEAQQRAERERLARQILEQIESAPDVQGVLQVATRELGRALRVPRTFIQLGIPEGGDDHAPSAGM
ncbi:MAG: GAF domain-containing protein [Thermoflexales bacterium]|nr:GAF domain-containing protein [Thermoflexales bacterium]